MASAEENIQILQSFWELNSSTTEVTPNWSNWFDAARSAMGEFMRAGLFDASTRAAFASSGLFEQALSTESGGLAGELASIKAHQAAVASGFGDFSRPDSPRKIMLDGLYEWGTGRGTGGIRSLARSFIEKPQPSGVIPWLHGSSGFLHVLSNTNSGALMSSAITNDPDVNVRISALKILTDVAYPAEWIEVFRAARTFASLDEQVPVKTWRVDQGADLATREALKSLSNRAQGRVQQVAAQFALASGGIDLTQMASFSAGDGTVMAALPMNLPPWYTDPRVWGVGLLGILGGAVGAAKRHRK
jgi:hypothetical protein